MHEKTKDKVKEENNKAFFFLLFHPSRPFFTKALNFRKKVEKGTNNSEQVLIMHIDVDDSFKWLIMSMTVNWG